MTKLAQHDEAKKILKAKNRATLVALLVLIAVLFIVTVIKVKSQS